MKSFAAVALLAIVVHAGDLQAQAVSDRPDRTVLERQFRERTAELIRTRLGLDTRQMEQLQQVNARYAPQLNRLAIQERETRRALRSEITMREGANQKRISELLDASLRAQRERLGIIESEQRDLAAFLTPLQRARYIALQAQFRKRADELARKGEGQSGRRLGGPPGRRPPRPRP